MEQGQLVHQAEGCTGSLKKNYGRYAEARLDQAYKYAFEEFHGKTAITAHLSELAGKIPAVQTAHLYLSLIQDMMLTETAAGDGKVCISEADERLLFSASPLQRGKYYYQPVVIEDYVVGYIALGLNDNPDVVLQELAYAYSVIAARELEMIRRQKGYEDQFREIEKKEAELEKIQEYTHRLLSITSHDLNSPISAISGYVDLMGECIKQEDHLMSGRLDKYHRRIDLGLSEVTDMLTQFRDLSKIESGSIKLNMVDVNINWPVRKVCDLLESQALKKDIQLTVVLPDEPAFVSADVVKLKRIVHNLVSNAIKYTPEGGQVVVKAACFADEVRLVVKDTGIGIRKRDQARIFAPSVKLDHSESNSHSSGLGLYIAYFFANLMDGAISVASKLQCGSLFTVKLPRVKVLLYENN